jgi:hypothetical protein
MRKTMIALALLAAVPALPGVALAQSSTAVGAGTGALAGAVVGGPIGLVVGGVVGGAVGSTREPRRYRVYRGPRHGYAHRRSYRHVTYRHHRPYRARAREFRPLG